MSHFTQYGYSLNSGFETRSHAFDPIISSVSETDRPGNKTVMRIFVQRFAHENTSNMADAATMEVEKNLKVGFIGGGNMARAIAEGFISSGVVSAGNITASATTDKTLAIWKVG